MASTRNREAGRRQASSDRGGELSGERLQKVLSHAGVASRRTAEEMIRAGRVRINGRAVRDLGRRVQPNVDRIDVDGREIRAADHCYVLLHKPRGVVSTLRDPEGRRTVRSLLPSSIPRVYPVGRLDVTSTGLLLLTNDGELAQRLTHPRFEVPRTYEAKVSGHPDARALERLRHGIRLGGRRSAPAVVRVLRSLSTKTWLEVTVTEGRNHLVRRLCDAIGHPVEKLARVRLGPLKLGGLPPGRHRFLTAREVASLRKGRAVAAASRSEAASPAASRRGRRRRRPARCRP
jgi:23S rRNA pseudouridine2605 synthase